MRCMTSPSTVCDSTSIVTGAAKYADSVPCSVPAVASRTRRSGLKSRRTNSRWEGSTMSATDASPSDEVLAEDLAERAARDLVAELDDPRHLERRQAIPAHPQQLAAQA